MSARDPNSPDELPGLGAAPAESASSPTARPALPAELVEFHRSLRQLTPRVYVTPALVGINALVFAWMTVSGVHPLTPTAADLLRWGADFGPNVASGEWWRLLSCTFVHIGILHIALNMWVLATAGPLVERMVGSVGFLVLYLLSGLCGSLASLFWNPMLVSAGASGAVFGVCGALLGLLLRQRGTIPVEVFIPLRNSVLSFMFYNLIFGLILKNIDSAAHIGGLAGGFLSGLVLSQPLATASGASRAWRNVLLLTLGGALVAGGMLAARARLADLVRVQQEWDAFATVEKRVLGELAAADEKARRQELSEAAFADLLEQDILPPWRSARQRFLDLPQIPIAMQPRITSLLEYMRLRQEAWEIMVPALREGNQAKWQEGLDRQRQAGEVIERLNDGK